jgi:iron complex outermembrane receptor protein
MNKQQWKAQGLVRELGMAGLLVASLPVLASDGVLLQTVKVEAVPLAQPARADGYWGSGLSRAATKTTTPLGELAQSVSVVTKEQIAAQHPATIGQALNYVPGAFSGLIGNATRYDYVALRGFTDSSAANTLLDGMRLLSEPATNSSLQVDPYFVDRIDLVRGPMSVLYGNSAPGGMVAMISKQPQQKAQHEVRLDVGSRAEQGLAFDFTGGLSDTLSYRLTGMGRQADSMQNHASEERQALMPQLMWQPGADTALLLQAYLQKDPKGGFHSGVPYEGAVSSHLGRKIDRTFSDGEPEQSRFDRDVSMLGYQFEHQLAAGWTFRQNLRITRSDLNTAQVYQTGWADPADTSLSRSYYGSGEKLKGMAVDTRVQGQFDSGVLGHDVVAGVDYQQRKTTGTQWSGEAQAIDALRPVYGNADIANLSPDPFMRKYHQTGLYLQDQISLDNWRLTGGIRYDRATTSAELSGNRPKRQDSEWSRRLGVLHQFANGLSPYVSYSESFDPGSSTDASQQLLKPTRAKQYESGVKYQQQGLMLSAALYDLEQKNVARWDIGASANVPVGTVRSRGLELEGQLALNRHWYVQTAYSTNRMDVRHALDAAAEGKRPVNAPTQLASGWLNYSPQQGARLGAGVRYIGKSYADAANTKPVPATTLLDVSASLELGSWLSSLKGASVQLSVNNLLDKDYVAACWSENYCYFGNARSVTTSLKYAW